LINLEEDQNRKVLTFITDYFSILQKATRPPLISGRWPCLRNHVEIYICGWCRKLEPIATDVHVVQVVTVVNLASENAQSEYQRRQKEAESGGL
jgi:hypothetical protein